MSCGEPGDVEVSLEIKELVLECDAGITSKPYWKADFRSGSRIQTILCVGCKRESIEISLSANARLDHAKESA